MKIRFAITPPASALREESFNDYLVAGEHRGFDTRWLSIFRSGRSAIRW